MDLKQRIDALVSRADELTEQEWKERGYFVNSNAPKHRADYISDKWCRVVTVEERGGCLETGSVYCFVALQDGHTKALGTIKTGDIHKGASFKAPSRHARGNVFLDDFGDALTAYGVKCLR